MNIDKVAEAIRERLDIQRYISHPVNEPDASWIDVDSLALAAVEALGLTEEWRVSRESWHRNVASEKVAHTDHVGATDKIHAVGLADGWDGAYIESRLVSPWVKADQ